MADIDFEELDQAVNRLMDQRKKDGQASSSLDSAPATTVSTPAADETPARSPSSHMDNHTSRPTLGGRGTAQSIATTPTAETSPASTSATPPPPTPPPTRSPAIKRRTGQFMDIVHPSQSMAKNGSARPAPSGRVSRSSATLSPMNDVTPTPQDDSVTVSQAESAVSEPSAPPTTADSIADRIAATLADHNKDSAQEITPPASEADDRSLPAQRVEPDDSAASAPVENTTPLQSPFLTGATVEKRPLGGTGEQPPIATAEFSGRHSDDEITPEMGEAVLAVEAREVNEPAEVAEPAAETAATPEEPSAAQAEPHEEELLLPATASPDKPAAPPSSSRPTRQTAVGDIPKQYAVTPSNEEEPSSIYDPAHYQESLEHPAKKKSSWWVVLWIVLLLIAGAGAGAAAYLYLLR